MLNTRTRSTIFGRSNVQFACYIQHVSHVHDLRLLLVVGIGYNFTNDYRIGIKFTLDWSSINNRIEFFKQNHRKSKTSIDKTVTFLNVARFFLQECPFVLLLHVSSTCITSTVGYNSRTNRHSYKLVKPHCQTNIRNHSFFYRVIETWNCLPEQVVTIVYRRI